MKCLVWSLLPCQFCLFASLSTFLRHMCIGISLSFGIGQINLIKQQNVKYIFYSRKVYEFNMHINLQYALTFFCMKKIHDELAVIA